MLITFSSLFLCLMFSLFISTSPMSMGIILLLLAIISSITISLLISNVLCFIMFLIYIGGTLVLFSYFMATSPNMPLPSINMISFILIMLPMLILMIISSKILDPVSPPGQLISFLYSNYTSFTLILFALILLYTMIVAVKLTNMLTGPLRPFYV